MRAAALLRRETGKLRCPDTGTPSPRQRRSPASAPSAIAAICPSEPPDMTMRATAASAIPARARSGVSVRVMPQIACATTATATSFNPCWSPSATGPVNAAAPSAKASRIMADGMVKANHAAKPPRSPLPRSTPSENPLGWMPVPVRTDTRQRDRRGLVRRSISAALPARHGNSRDGQSARQPT